MSSNETLKDREQLQKSTFHRLLSGAWSAL